MKLTWVFLSAALLFVQQSQASDEFTLYDLLAPETHQFAIRYDVAATAPGMKVFYNIIRPGSEASNEKGFDRATGKELPFVMTDAKEAKAAGQSEADVPDATPYIKVPLPRPVTANSEFRLRILKTYKDAKSYYSQADKIVFDRSLGVKRNIVLLPADYELIGSTVPVIMDIENGRVKISMVNDRQDELQVRITGRKLSIARADQQKTPPPGQQTQTAQSLPPAPEHFHRAEDDREITYWLLDPETHQFRFSHDFNIDRPGQKYAHSFVRKGSKVSPETTFIDLDSGKRLKTSIVTGKEVNTLGYYPERSDDDDVVVQGELLKPIAAGQTARIRVMETYTDPDRYYIDKNGELVWDRTFGRPRNVLTLPEGWYLTDCSTSASIALDEEGRIQLFLNNPRNDEIHVIVHAHRRK